MKDHPEERDGLRMLLTVNHAAILGIRVVETIAGYKSVKASSLLNLKKNRTIWSRIVDFSIEILKAFRDQEEFESIFDLLGFVKKPIYSAIALV